MVKASIRNAWDYFCRILYLPSNGLIEKIVLMTLTYLLEDKKIGNVNISETIRANVKMQGTTFEDFDVCNQMASLPKFYFLILMYLF